MQEFIALEAARNELLSSFGITDEKWGGPYCWYEFKYRDMPWTIWKDGPYVKLFWIDDCDGNIRSTSFLNKREMLLITDNEDYVLYRCSWSEKGTSHYTHIILPKRRMVNHIDRMETYLKYSKKPFQIMFERGVKNSCSLNHS